METQSYIFGRNAIIEALSAGKPIEKIFFAFGVQGEPINRIHALAKRNKVSTVVHDKRKFSQLELQVCNESFKSQGVIALIRQFEVYPLDELVNTAYLTSDKPILVILDEISDPHNLGAIARSAECSGASGLIVPERNSAPITPVAIKASAGALEYLPISKVSSFPQTFQYLKDRGFWVIGTDMSAEKSYTADIYDSPVALVIGSEGDGMRPSTRNHCDILIKIPMIGKINSLNASVSAGIVLFEILKQRSEKYE